MGEFITKKTLRYGLLIFLFLLSIPILFSCEETTGPEVTTPSVARKLLIYSDKDTIPANGGLTQILVKVYAGDDTTNVISGTQVDFSANQAGTKLYIQVKNDITDSNGIARAILYAGSRAGTAGITASIENYSNIIFINITSGAGLVVADPSSILADGIKQSTITATVIDSLGQPLPGSPVNFVASNNATITPQSYSDENGHATAILRSIPSVIDISCIVTASTDVGKIAVAKTATDGAAKSSSTEGMLGTTTVVFKGITITGSVDRSTILANNADSSMVSINVKETTSGDPVEGAVLKYSSNLGQLRAEDGESDSNGYAEVNLFGANTSGTAVFTATITEGLAFTAEISLIKQVFMSLQSNPSVLSANGTDTSTITAFLRYGKQSYSGRNSLFFHNIRQNTVLSRNG